MSKGLRWTLSRRSKSGDTFLIYPKPLMKKTGKFPVEAGPPLSSLPGLVL